MSKTDFKFHTSLRVRWMECDAQGIVFNGAYLNYLEVGQAEYFRNLGFSIYRIAQRGYFDSAVVKITIEYKAPARVEDDLEIFVGVAKIGNTSLTLDAEIYPQASDRLLTTIQAIYVGYDSRTGETRPVPNDIRLLLNHFESTGEALSLEQFPELLAAAE
jgi:acyl-CoA thioester hydrolase